MRYKDKKVLVYDTGAFVSVALRLAEDFGKVFYFCNWKRDFSRTQDLNIGQGFSEFTWVRNFWDCINNDKPDLVVFTDILDSDLQDQLLRMGINVWGAREADAMEIYKWDFIEYQKKIGMPVPESIHVTGIDNLRKELYSTLPRWIKIDADQRGDIETFKYIEPEATELSILLPLERNLGSSSKTIQFIIQDNIEADVETGYDGWVIDGQFSKQSFFGIEVKAKAYIGEAREYSKLPESVRYCNDKLVPALKAYGMRGSFHTEIREGSDGKYYLIDMTMRFGYPPSNIMMEMIDNFAEIIYEGAQGKIVEPVFRAKYGCEVIVKSPLAMDNDFKLIVPDEIRQWVKQPFCYKNSKTGSVIVMKKLIPNDIVGSVVAIGDTPEEAVELCEQRLELLNGYMLSYDYECLEDAMEQLKEL